MALTVRLALAATVALAAAPVRAWSPAGHAAVGAVAERSLSPAARAAVDALLEGKRISDPDVAAWADAESKEGRAPRAFHYVNVPVDAPGYDPARDCREGRCAVAKLDAELAALRDPAIPRARRGEALRWVVHLAGDLHQPLHCADRGDRGGNETRVVRRGPDTNLHAFWDSMPERCRIGRSVAIPDAEGAAAGTPRAWLDECHVLGRAAYAQAAERETGGGVRFEKEDRAQQCAVARRQIARAGVRLAAVLNEALGR
jgi:hypothetical protein